MRLCEFISHHACPCPWQTHAIRVYNKVDGQGRYAAGKASHLRRVISASHPCTTWPCTCIRCAATLQHNTMSTPYYNEDRHTRVHAHTSQLSWGVQLLWSLARFLREKNLTSPVAFTLTIPSPSSTLRREPTESLSAPDSTFTCRGGGGRVCVCMRVCVCVCVCVPHPPSRVLPVSVWPETPPPLCVKQNLGLASRPPLVEAELEQMVGCLQTSVDPTHQVNGHMYAMVSN